MQISAWYVRPRSGSGGYQGANKIGDALDAHLCHHASLVNLYRPRTEKSRGIAVGETLGIRRDILVHPLTNALLQQSTIISSSLLSVNFSRPKCVSHGFENVFHPMRRVRQLRGPALRAS